MRSRSARLSVYCRTIARSSEAHAQNGASCSSERRRRRAIGCPFKLEYIWYAFEPRIYRGFKRLRPRGFKWDSGQPSIRYQRRKRRAATTAANGRDGWKAGIRTRLLRELSDYFGNAGIAVRNS